MSANSKISWTDATWPIVVGCEKVSTGCANCYAVKEANRMAGNPNPKISQVYSGLVERQENGILNWTGVVRCLPGRLDWPLAQKKPARIFTSSLGDLFHPSVPFEFLDQVFLTMARASWHTFQILTKQPARMLEYFQYAAGSSTVERTWNVNETTQYIAPWPLPNVWVGTSAENQKTAGERIPLLLQVPAVIRFISAEPLLGPIDLTEYIQLTPTNEYDPDSDKGWGYDSYSGGFVSKNTSSDIYNPQPGIHWVIAGGESGYNVRHTNPDWVRWLRDQCNAAEIAFHFKQWGSWLPCDHDPQSPSYQKPLDTYIGETYSYRQVGKKQAGRELDGRTWDEYPEVAE